MAIRCGNTHILKLISAVMSNVLRTRSELQWIDNEGITLGLDRLNIPPCIGITNWNFLKLEQTKTKN